MICVNKKNKQKGFSLIETLVYLFITSMLLLMIASLVVNIFNSKRLFKSEEVVARNARYIMSFMLNKMHNVGTIDDLGGGSQNIMFYVPPDRRFNLAIESDNFVYRETQDVGSGYPDQSTAVPYLLNSDNVQVSDITLTPMSDNYGQTNQGVVLSFTLTYGNSEDKYGYAQRTYSTFLSIR
jgi:type II secretory pathway pseudopilin PulG